MEIGVPLTVVASQGEADVICSMLRAEGIECSERLADSAESGFSREILVAPTDLAWARELLASAES
jgi:hypothetical protein